MSDAASVSHSNLEALVCCLLVNPHPPGYPCDAQGRGRKSLGDLRGLRLALLVLALGLAQPAHAEWGVGVEADNHNRGVGAGMTLPGTWAPPACPPLPAGAPAARPRTTMPPPPLPPATTATDGRE